MKPEIKLFFDMEFTSLSPDAQIISLGIVSSYSERIIADATPQGEHSYNSMGGQITFRGIIEENHSKSFYAEFSDFQIERCDDWVKENVVGKLKLGNKVLPGSVGKHNVFKLEFRGGAKYILYQKERLKDDHQLLVQFDSCPMVYGNTNGIKESLSRWLSQFSDYNIQFVGDCGTFDWYHLLQLIGEWDEKEGVYYLPIDEGKSRYTSMMYGLPKLPSNISPVPQDLNDLIALKKGISVREAFDLNREKLAFPKVLVVDESKFNKEEIAKIKKQYQEEGTFEFGQEIGGISDPIEKFKHNSLFDAHVIKAIYEKLK